MYPPPPSKSLTLFWPHVKESVYFVSHIHMSVTQEASQQLTGLRSDYSSTIMSSLKSINSKMHNNKVVLIENTKIKCTIREFLFPPIYHSFIVLCPSSICQVPTFCSCVRKHWSTVVFLLYIFSIMAMIRKLLAYQKHP